MINDSTEHRLSIDSFKIKCKKTFLKMRIGDWYNPWQWLAYMILCAILYHPLCALMCDNSTGPVSYALFKFEPREKSKCSWLDSNPTLQCLTYQCARSPQYSPSSTKPVFSLCNFLLEKWNFKTSLEESKIGEYHLFWVAQ